MQQINHTTGLLQNISKHNFLTTLVGLIPPGSDPPHALGVVHSLRSRTAPPHVWVTGLHPFSGEGRLPCLPRCWGLSELSRPHQCRYWWEDPLCPRALRGGHPPRCPALPSAGGHLNTLSSPIHNFFRALPALGRTLPSVRVFGCCSQTVELPSPSCPTPAAVPQSRPRRGGGTGNAYCRVGLPGCSHSHGGIVGIGERWGEMGREQLIWKERETADSQSRGKSNSGSSRSQESPNFHSPSRLLTCHRFSLSRVALPWAILW